MTDQAPEQAQPWPFALAYKEKFGQLPPSQQREAIKRLTMRARAPLAPEKLGEESADVEACLTGLFAAYSSKKARARVASATKRANERVKKAESATQVEASAGGTPCASAAEPSASAAELSAVVTELRLEPAAIVCEAVGGPPHPAQSPTPAQTKPTREQPPTPTPSRPSLPTPQPLSRACATIPIPMAQKAAPAARGLGAMLRR